MAMLEKRAPLPDLDLVMRQLFGDVGFAPTLTPAADVYESPSELIVELDVPGFDEKQLTVAISDHVLTVTGERTEEIAKTDETLRLRERLESHFERRFQLPPETDTERMSAEYGKGVLTLHVPKVKAKPRTVEIAKT
ncbi:MAG TPA: Hsp20/alpha crystallin family protein [Gaiellaceae bacterium]|jgi:HSP20 family protein|nr:Hsp20/alpha crystallin family protein [Gaiellaceae bacterium]